MGPLYIVIPRFALDTLRHHRAQQLERRLRAQKWENADIMFSTAVGGYKWVATVHKDFKKLLLRAGLPADIRFHDLRHSAATILLCMGCLLR